MRTKLFTFITGTLLFVAFQAQSQNLLTDGDFSLTTEINNYGYLPPNEWCELKSDNAVADAKVIDGVCFYEVINSGYSTWEVQLMQGGFNLEPGHYYRLTFDVKADANTQFGLFLGENEGSWNSLIGYDRYFQNATAEWQTISLDFKTTCGIFPYHKLSFELGTVTTNMYFDNVVLEDLELYPNIGILGSSLNGWEEDIEMQTTDGIIYTLKNYPLVAGDAKFRQDKNWCRNWGGVGFPNDTIIEYGPNINIISPGTYDITLNLKTKEYSFDCVSNCLPSIGIIGSAVPPNFEYGPDVNLTTTDGIIYTLKNHDFIDGKANFRKDDDWKESWGEGEFPSGTAYLNGPPIPVKAGNYTVTFNIETGEYNFKSPSIGILGSALNGWDEDIDMKTDDNVNFYLYDVTLTEGDVKFRADDSWDINWGGYEFPHSWGFQDGPNIFVLAGTYKIFFNRLTGEYTFKAISCPIAGIQCPYTVYMPSDPGVCGAKVFFPPVTAAPNCGGDGIIIEQTGGLPSGSIFPIGYTTNTFLLTNADGNTATCSFDVFVYDFEPPVITISENQTKTLWPVNHQMVNVALDYTVTTNCNKNYYTYLYIYTNEPEDVKGGGNVEPDWEIVDNYNVLLRAERSAKAEGREYYISLLVCDESWNCAYEQITITVPHDMGVNEIFGENNLIKSKSATIISPDNNLFKTNVYPNPSNSVFNIQIESLSDEPVSISIYDISGRLISRSSESRAQGIIIGQEINPGLYFLTISQDDNSETVKIIKNE